MSRRPSRAARSPCLVLAHPPEQVLALDQIEVGERDGGGHRMAAERQPVREVGRLRLERRRDALGHDQRAHRHVGRGQALRRRDQVGHVIEALPAEPRAQPAPRADRVVGDQQHAVAVADLAHALEVARRRDQAAARVLHRLEDHGRDGLAALGADPRLDRVGRPQAGRPAVAVGVRDVAARRAGAARTASARTAARSPTARPASCRGRRARARSPSRAPARR